MLKPQDAEIRRQDLWEITRDKSAVGGGLHIAISALIRDRHLPFSLLSLYQVETQEERAIYKPESKPSPGLSMLPGTLGLDMKASLTIGG